MNLLYSVPDILTDAAERLITRHTRSHAIYETYHPLCPFPSQPVAMLRITFYMLYYAIFLQSFFRRALYQIQT